VRLVGLDALDGVAHAIAGVDAEAVGIHHLLVRAEAQQVVAERPFEVEAGRFAGVEAAADAGVGRVATLGQGGRPEQAGVFAVAADDAAPGIPRAAAGGAALVLAVHRLGGEVVPEVAGVGDRPVVAAGARGALAGLLAQHGAIPVVQVARRFGLGLVGERQEFQLVVVVDLPIELAAPEIVVALGDPGLGLVD